MVRVKGLEPSLSGVRDRPSAARIPPANRKTLTQSCCRTAEGTSVPGPAGHLRLGLLRVETMASCFRSCR